MKEIVFFVTRGKHPDVIRYVGEVKTYCNLWTKVKFTVDVRKAAALDPKLKAKAMERIAKLYGDTADIDTVESGLEVRESEKSFYMIICEDDGRELYFESISKDGTVKFTDKVREAYISQSRKDIEDTLVNVRVHGGGKVRYVAVSLNIDNTLQAGNFVIICKSKFSGKKMFLKERYMDGEIALHPKSSSAKKLGYDEAVEWYEWLKEKHKQNLYAVIVAPEENIKATQINKYMEEYGRHRAVAISIKLPK